MTAGKGKGQRCGRPPSLKSHIRPDASDEFVAQDTEGIDMVKDSAARIQHILDVRLDLPPRCDLDLIGDLYQRLDALHREGTPE